MLDEYFIQGPHFLIGVYGGDSARQVEDALVAALSRRGFVSDRYEWKYVGSIADTGRHCVDVARDIVEDPQSSCHEMVTLTITAMHHELAEDDPSEQRIARAISQWMLDVLFDVCRSSPFYYAGIAFETAFPSPQRLRECLAGEGLSPSELAELCVSRLRYDQSAIERLIRVYERGYLEVWKEFVFFSNTRDFNPLGRDFLLVDADQIEIASVLLSGLPEGAT